jgi:hypothetical protein
MRELAASSVNSKRESGTNISRHLFLLNNSCQALLENYLLIFTL